MSRRWYDCHARERGDLCGGDDCRTCHPENFDDDGRFIANGRERRSVQIMEPKQLAKALELVRTEFEKQIFEKRRDDSGVKLDQ